MKQLFLIRHAKSSWEDTFIEDRLRPLNGRGKKDAPLMGRMLVEKNLSFDRIISSPAHRAWSTAKKLCKSLGIPKEEIVRDERLYGATVETLYYLLQEVDDSVEHLALVGHNPTLTEFVNRLIDNPIANLPTCGIIVMGLSCTSWQALSHDCYIAHDFLYPKLFK